MTQLLAVILAAGEGKRMATKNSKVMHKICGRPMIDWVLDTVKQAGIEEKVLVVGHKADQLQEHLKDSVKYAFQEVQLGTGHAVMQACEYLDNFEGYAFVLYGDTPLINPQTLLNTLEYHKKGGFAATVVTAELKDPSGYGRVIRDSEGNLKRVVEHKDASDVEKSVKEVNSGIYCFTAKHLSDSLQQLKNNNNQGEYYLPDTLEILLKKGLKVGVVKTPDCSEIAGVNDRVQLYEASEIIRDRLIKKLMRAGITVIDPRTTHIDGSVEIGRDTVIYPGTILEGSVRIGEDCIIGPNTRIVGSSVGNGVEIANSVVLESSVDDNANIGPFAYIRPGSRIGRKVKIGDFVEIKNSSVGDKTKIPHLSYIGDSEVGRNCNIACGVITSNYNGKQKYKTIIGDNAFVGCNVNLVAPVEVKDNSYIAAGSTITDDVPEYSLAIARERQTIKEDWVNRKGMKRVEKD